VRSKNSIVSIHNPTLRFLAKWLAMVVHSRTDLRLCSLPELAHWQKMITAKGPIDKTPLVTRVARYVKANGGRRSHFLARDGGVQIRGRS